MTKKGSLIEQSFYLLRFFLPFIAEFFGYLIWADLYHLIFGDTARKAYILAVINGLWFIFLFWIFFDVFRKSPRSKILTLLMGFFITMQYFGIRIYNAEYSYLATVVDRRIYGTILMWIIWFSILGSITLAIAIVMPHFHAELTHLTKIEIMKNTKRWKLYRILEIIPSFPVFIGIYQIRFLEFHKYFNYYKYQVPPYAADLIALPWIFLMYFYVFYSILVILKHWK